jgi:hypothetical protein
VHVVGIDAQQKRAACCAERAVAFLQGHSIVAKAHICATSALNHVLPAHPSYCCPHTAERAPSSCLSSCWDLVHLGGRRTLQPILSYVLEVRG